MNTLDINYEYLKSKCQSYFKLYVDSTIDNKVYISKYTHTNNVVNDTFEVSQIFGFRKELIDLFLSSAILHDFGRFEQYRLTDSFFDVISFSKNNINIDGVNDHGDLGAYLLKTKYLKELIPFIRIYDEYLINVVKEHSKIKPSMSLFDRKVDVNELNKLDLIMDLINKGVYSDLFPFSIQLIRDMDKVDIYNQRSNAKSVLSDNYHHVKEGETLSSIANFYGISESDLKDANGIDGLTLKKLNIPIALIPIEKLHITDYVRRCFSTGTQIDLKIAQKESGYNTLCAMVVQLNFLNDINFVNTLKLILKRELLEKIYSMYDGEYQKILSPYFNITYDRIKTKIKTNSVYAQS